MTAGTVVDIEKERAPRPCDEHWQTFTTLNPNSVFVLSEETRNEECGYCQIERMSKSGGGKHRRCIKCKDGIIVHQSRNIEHIYAHTGSREIVETFIGPITETCTRGCSHRIDNGKWIKGKK